MSWKDFWRRLNQSCKLSTSSPFSQPSAVNAPHNFTNILLEAVSGRLQGSLVPPMMASIGIRPLKRKKFASKVLPQHVAGFLSMGRKVGVALEKKMLFLFQTCKLSLKFVVVCVGFIFFEVLEVPTHLVGFLLNANFYPKKKRPNPKVPPGILKHRPW